MSKKQKQLRETEEYLRKNSINGIISEDGNKDSGNDKSYLEKSFNQVLRGNYTDDVTLLGTAGQVALGFAGVDLPADIRDITYDLTNWKWSWGHAGQTLADIAALIPVVGALKYTDEAGALIKNAVKYSDETADLLQESKYLDEAIEAADAVKLTKGTGETAAKYAEDAAKYIDDAAKGAGKILKRDEFLNSVQNDKLRNAVDQIYRPNASIGDGGLGDAVRHEISTGELVGGKSHITKAKERIKNLENILKNQDLNSSDKKIISELIKDLTAALGGS